MKKGLPVVLLLAVVAFFLSAFVAAMVEKHGLFLVIVVALIIVAAIVALFVLVKKKRAHSEKKKMDAQSRVVKITVPDVKAVPASAGSMVYDDVGLYRPPNACGPMPDEGEELTFVEEPDNPVDDKAIKAVYYDENCEEQVAGYLNRTKLREMVRDWLDRGDVYTCYVESNSPKLTAIITFYK